jgi:hypothetical protein
MRSSGIDQISRIVQMAMPATRFRMAVAGVLAAAGIVVEVGPAFCQAPAFNEYAVKFVCGKSAGASAPVAQGFYFTDINVHNPNSEPANFKKKFAIALPFQKPGPISELVGATLKPDEAFSVECQEITKRLGLPAGSFVTGFAVFEIIPKQELDVVAVYTAASSPTTPVVTMHMERVPKRP